MRRETLAFYAYISPWLLGLLVFTSGPILASLGISLMRWDLVTPARFVGLGNYADMLFEDDLFWHSLRVTLVYTLFRVPLSLAAAIALALLMNRNVPGIGIFRTIFYLPTVVSGVAVSMLWLWTFNPNFGLVNGFLEAVGIPGPGWFADADWALGTMVLTSLYGVGGTAVIFLAGLKNIPASLYEAAELDGAGRMHKFRYITIPQLTPTVLFNLIILLIHSLQTFTEALVITKGGPVNATLFYNLYLYQNAFSYSKLGYACSLAWVLFVVTMGLSYYTFRTSRKWVYYEGGER